MRKIPLAAIILGVLPIGVAADDLPAQIVGAHGLALPATFTGVLPCADCPGIRHQLDLWPGGGYALRREYIDLDDVVEEFGRWHVAPTRRALVLSGEDGLQWQILGNGHLRLLDEEGQPIESDLPYGLEPGPLAPFDVTLPMTGEFVYFADAALFTECMTGERYPVTNDGDYLAIERAYLDARPAPMAPLLVRIDGRIAEAPAMEGPPRRSVTVERLHHVTPGGACISARPPAPLVDTYWRILEIDGEDLPPGTRREPYLLLLAGEDQRFSATVGCNMMTGPFTLEEARIGFSRTASTMMACPPGLDTAEASLAVALSAVARFDSDGHVLRLRDADGNVRLRLAAVHVPWF